MYMIRLMVKILHYLKDPKLWELRYIPYYEQCRILTINSSTLIVAPRDAFKKEPYIRVGDKRP